MKPEFKPLALRRAELIGECAQQRAAVAQEFALLRLPFTGGLPGRLAGNRKLVLAVAGAGLGLLAVRPRRLLRAAAGALALVKAVRQFFPLLPR